MTARGIRNVRNNNPGNVRIGSPWVGLMPPARMTPEQRDEAEFCVFESPVYGFRAMAVTLLAYQNTHGLWTPRAWVTRWAPPSENNTSAYIQSLCAQTGFEPEQTVDLKVIGNLEKASKAFAYQESGGWFFTDADLHAGCSLALLNTHGAAGA